MTGQGLDERRLRTLLDVGRGLVSQLDREALLRRVLEAARELTGARYAAVGVLDEDRGQLERFLVSGIDEDTHRAIGDLPTGQGILGELIRLPKPLRLADISEHPRSYGFPPGHPPMRTFLGVPIMLRGEAWGNIYLTEKEGGEFDELDEESLVVLAEWAAIAIDNARLYGQVDSRRGELERAVQGLEATTAIARAVGGETDLSRVLELVAKRGRALVEARSLLILLREGDDLVVVAGAGETDTATLGERISTEGNVLGQLLKGGHAERLTEVSSRVRVGIGELARDASTAMLVPLTFRAKTVGVLVALDRIEGKPFTDEDERLMRAFASSAATAVATAQTVEADQLRLGVEASEAERGRWARELHDETLQGLTALQVLLSASLQRGDPETVGNAAEQAVEQIADEIEKLQTLITELRPAALDEIGLTPALESLLERIRSVHGLDVAARLDLDYQAGRSTTRLQPDIERTAYRLVQEALTNVAKHSGASKAHVAVVEDSGQITVEIGDDGKGFDTDATHSGFGLLGMHERVDLVGGRLTITSTPGSGSVITAELPGRHREEPAASERSAAGAA